MFLRAARSVLNQSLRELELIIVDDGSTDGTAEQIASLMRTDGRVSCLRHPENIGLPAISEYEALQRARGEYIAFGFDDFIFDRDALSSLVTFPLTSPGCAVHGYVAWFDQEGNQQYLGKEPVPHERLKFFNFLANASFLIPRAIFSDVGLFDPHVAAARLYDWDLWCRILRRYPIHRAPIFVGTEYGFGRPDSLGNTYPLFEETLQEYFAQDRKEALKIDNYPEFDIWRMPEGCSFLLATHVRAARRFFELHNWARGLHLADLPEPLAADPIIGIYGALVPSPDSLFENVSEADRKSLLFIHPDLSDHQLAWYLGACGAVIIVGDVPDARAVRVNSMCGAMDIPLHHFTRNEHRPISLAEIRASSMPADAISWPDRLKKLVAHILLRERLECERKEAELSALSTRLAAAEAELASRSYRLALQVRMLANVVRKIAGRLRLR